MATGCDQTLAEGFSSLAVNKPKTDRFPPRVYQNYFVVRNSPYLKALPSGLTKSEFKFFSRVFSFLRDSEAPYSQMKSLEFEIISLVGSLAQPAEKARAMLALFKYYEDKYSFKTTALDRHYSQLEFRELLQSGFLFLDFYSDKIDLVFAPRGLDLSLNRHLDPKPLVKWRHGAVTHRLQWHLVLRDIERNPELYFDKGEKMEVLDFYKKLGDANWLAALDWTETGIQKENPDLFFELFDSHENNYSNPGFFIHNRKAWPNMFIF